MPTAAAPARQCPCAASLEHISGSPGALADFLGCPRGRCGAPVRIASKSPAGTDWPVKGFRRRRCPSLSHERILDPRNLPDIRASIMDFDPLLLARVQFAFTIAFHIIFPSFTIGLSAYIATLEVMWLRT